MNRLPTILITLAVLLALGIALSTVVPSRFGVGSAFAPSGLPLVWDGSEIGVYFDRSDWVAYGAVPYRESFVEYPQLALLYLSWPRLLTDDIRTYHLLLMGVNAAVYLGLVLLTGRLLQRAGQSLGWLWIFFHPSLVYFGLNRFDGTVALVTVAALIAVRSNRARSAGLLLAAAFLIKWYALLFVPFVALYLAGRVGGAQRVTVVRQLLVSFVLPVAVTFAVTFAWAGWATFTPYLIHLGRGVEWGSLTGLVAFSLVRHVPSWAFDLLVALTSVCAIGVPLAATFGWRSIVHRLDHFEQLAGWCAATLLVFFLFTRFFSPQWLLWLVPVALVAAPTRRTLALMVITATSNYSYFPLLYDIDKAYFPLFYSIATVEIGLFCFLLLDQLKRLGTAAEHPLGVRP